MGDEWVMAFGWRESMNDSGHFQAVLLRVRTRSGEKGEVDILSTTRLPLMNLTAFLCKRLVTLVEGDLKASLSIATSLRCRGGRYSIPRIVPLYSWSLTCNAEYKLRRHKYHFLSLWYDPTLDWTAVSRTIGEHSIHMANGLVSFIQSFWMTTVMKCYSQLINFSYSKQWVCFVLWEM